MRVKITPLAPVHIGSGDDLTKLDFYTKDRRFYRINFDSLIEDEELRNNPKKLDDILKKIENGENIEKIFDETILQKHILYNLPLSQSCRSVIGGEVKEFIKSNNRVYIPGSSLKGAILSGVIYSVVSQNKILLPTKPQGQDELLNKVLPQISRIPYYKKDKFSQWLTVSDSEFKNPSDSLEISKAVVKYKDGKREGPQGYCETLKENISFEAQLATSITLEENGVKSYNFGKPEKDLLKDADKFYKKIYQEEKKINFIDLPDVPENKSWFLLRIGQGSTKLSTSLVMLANNIQQPKTIKVVGDESSRYRSMGWIKIEVLNK